MVFLIVGDGSASTGFYTLPLRDALPHEQGFRFSKSGWEFSKSRFSVFTIEGEDFPRAGFRS